MSQKRRERRKLLREIQKMGIKKEAIQHLLTQADGEELRRKYMQKIKNEEIQSSGSLPEEPGEISFNNQNDYSGFQNLIINKNWDPGS
jgi:hypothetical protein